METIVLDGAHVTIKQIVAIAHHESVHVEVDAGSRERLARSRFFIEEAVRRGDVIYGVTTGFGSFKNVVISPEQTGALQRNLIMSHAVGVGLPLTLPETRAMIAVRINSLIKGYSGVRETVIDTLLAFLNKGVYSFIPHKGSVGASGDLAPLAHLVCTMMGVGEAFVDGRRVPATEALAIAGIAPLALSSKEGLALTNGTSMMAGVACLNINKAMELVEIVDVAAAMHVEALMGSLVPFHAPVHEIRPHKGQQECAAHILSLTAGSEIVKSHEGCGRVQDSYTLRCIPQVHGAVRDTLRYARQVLEIEINSATDNPLIFPDEGIVRSAGNFHGEPMALIMDFVRIAMADLANICERRIAKAVDHATNEGLPSFLIPLEHAGLSNGFMIMQYTAAALVSENKTLAHPASIDSIPTSANQEDHVSMGANATFLTKSVLENVERVVGIELLTAAQALDLRKPLVPGVGSRAAREHIRQYISFVEKDRILYHDIERILLLMQDGSLMAAVNKACSDTSMETSHE